jgi:hypothetical protein
MLPQQTLTDAEIKAQSTTPVRLDDSLQLDAGTLFPSPARAPIDQSPNYQSLFTPYTNYNVVVNM